MGESSKKNNYTRELIIGLGESSFKKNYYPELQKKIFELERINARTNALLEAAPDILMVSDEKNSLRILSASSTLINEFAYFLYENEKTRTMIEQVSKQTKDNKDFIEISFDVIYKDKKYYLDMRCHKAHTNETVIVIRDITQRILLENQLREAAEKDSLTNLYNRRSFENKIAQLQKEKKGNLALVLIDIDGLKLINDTLGHVEGDRLIILTVEILKSVFSDFGFIARVGGDEFAILMYDVDYQVLESFLSSLKDKINNYNQDNNHYSISLSFGYSIAKTEEVSSEMLFQQADNNMYQNKLLNTASTKSYLVSSLMKALEARDYITEGHADRMDKHAYLMGRAIGLPSAQLDQLKLLAKFHDIGKVGIPDAILNKPSQLNDAEFKIMKTHPQIGERIAKESGELSGISHLILRHHERWDGTGYPDGLSGEDIPIGSRIISIVDAYDAMTNDRPYRKALLKSDALNELKRCSGSQFDPQLVDVFFKII